MNYEISLKGIACFGYHGVMPEERKEGQNFYVDVDLSTNLNELHDDLKNTIDYSKVVELVVEAITGEPVNLIETLAKSISEKVLDFDNKISEVKVSVHKPSAPVSAQISDVSVAYIAKR